MNHNGSDVIRSTSTIPAIVAEDSDPAAMSASRPDDQLAHLLEGLDYQPVFIMGDHRTGTTLLYQLLAATGRFAVVTAYHVIEYDRIVAHRLDGTEELVRRDLAERFASLGLANRGLDDVAVTPDTPEEYGFLLESDGIGRAWLGPEARGKVDELCRKVRFLSGDDRPVLLKNPWDFWNFRRVKAAFPGAAFIFLHRNPIRVINSQLSALRSLYTSRNAYLDLLASWYGPLFERPVLLRMLRMLCASPLAFRVTFRHVRVADSYYLNNIAALPASDFIDLRYEDLCSDPSAAAAKVMAFLGMGSAPSLDLRPMVRNRDASLLPEVDRRAESIARALDPYFRRWGYTSETR